MSPTTEDESRIKRLDGLVYGLTGLTTGFGVYLALYRLLITPPEFSFWVGVLVLAPITVVLLGYTERSFAAAVFVGALPATGTFFGQFLRELTLSGVASGLAGAFVPAVIVLPVSGVLYIVGVGLRRDGTLTDRKRGLAVRLLACTAVGIGLYLLQAAMLLTRISDHGL